MHDVNASFYRSLAASTSAIDCMKTPRQTYQLSVEWDLNNVYLLACPNTGRLYWISLETLLTSALPVGVALIVVTSEFS